MQLPVVVNSIGYVSSVLAMLGAFFVATARKPLLITAFSLWVFTNAFELFVSYHYYHNYWMTFQFAFFFFNAIFGIVMWIKSSRPAQQDHDRSQ